MKEIIKAGKLNMELEGNEAKLFDIEKNEVVAKWTTREGFELRMSNEFVFMAIKFSQESLDAYINSTK